MADAALRGTAPSSRRAAGRPGPLLSLAYDLSSASTSCSGQLRRSAIRSADSRRRAGRPCSSRSRRGSGSASPHPPRGRIRSPAPCISGGPVTVQPPASLGSTRITVPSVCRCVLASSLAVGIEPAGRDDHDRRRHRRPGRQRGRTLPSLIRLRVIGGARASLDQRLARRQAHDLQPADDHLRSIKNAVRDSVTSSRVPTGMRPGARGRGRPSRSSAA